MSGTSDIHMFEKQKDRLKDSFVEMKSKQKI
jgi:hypothetical protein